MKAFKAAGGKAEERYNRSALWISIGNLSAWILLNLGNPSDKLRVRLIRIYEVREGVRYNCVPLALLSTDTRNDPFTLNHPNHLSEL